MLSEPGKFRQQGNCNKSENLTCVNKRNTDDTLICEQTVSSTAKTRPMCAEPNGSALKTKFENAHKNDDKPNCEKLRGSMTDP